MRASNAPLVAIEDITFDLKRGNLVALLGPSGCGKTTFLKIVAGLIPATSGTVKIAGVDVSQPHPDFGVVFQQANLM
ncbi:MAG TPA: ATP-binding cassette domain-containing protein, partial [Pseudolabrys sp.]|nr:ATP-binding cassette domain-containing protein [Pseudolabrys sp.]